MSDIDAEIALEAHRNDALNWLQTMRENRHRRTEAILDFVLFSHGHMLYEHEKQEMREMVLKESLRR